MATLTTTTTVEVGVTVGGEGCSVCVPVIKLSVCPTVGDDTGGVGRMLCVPITKLSVPHNGR